MAGPGLGFVAKTLCSNVFLGRYTVEQALADIPDEPITRLIRTRVDRENSRVTASVPLVAKREAVYREGWGCTLVSDDGSVAAMPAIALAKSSPDSGALWPEGERIDTTTAADPCIDRGRLDAAIDNAFAEPNPALLRNTRAIVVVHNGRIIAERYADGYSAENRFPGWSMTKSVTSALVGVMAGEGRLALQDSALRAEWRTPGDRRNGIRLDDLLHMSSGLDFDESYTATGGATRMLFDSHDSDDVAAASAIAYEPGTHWLYSSGTTNIIVQYMRDRIGNDSLYFSFPRTALFDRIGMQSAVIEPDPSGTFVGSSFIHATARDWARFGLLYLRDGVWNGQRILPEGWVHYSRTPAPAAPRGQYGAQWWLNAGTAADSTDRPWPDLPRDIFYASGFQGQHVVVVPSHDLVVVRLGVTHNDRAWSLGGFLRDVLAAVCPSSSHDAVVAHGRVASSRRARSVAAH